MKTSPFLLLMNATKVLGVASVVALVLDGIAYHWFRRENLLPFDSTIDEEEEVLAKFAVDKDVDDGGFFFALGTAPAHVEDNLQDAWLEFASATEKLKSEESKASSVRDTFYKKGPENGFTPPLSKLSKENSAKAPGQTAKDTLRWIKKVSSAVKADGDRFNVVAWQNACHPEQRLRFWSEPDTELELAKNANVKIFRMGVDWSRIMPAEPLVGIEKAIQWDAVTRYREIIERVRAHGMGVMLTLFHHSLPSWAARLGGWRNPRTWRYFVDFTKVVVENYADLVDYWVTFNEPHVFILLTYFAGRWPGGNPNFLEIITSIMPNGIFNVIMGAMVQAHNQAYDIIHDTSNKLSKKTKVGVAHHVSCMRPYRLLDVPVAMFSDLMTRFAFLDSTVKKLDYIGINYYGQEVLNTPGLKHLRSEEYSESGRCVYPDGLYRVLISFHERYKKFNLPFIVTENGVSDSTDYIRRPFITEHLLAVQAAMNKGVPVHGYCFWTTSDNWEWADGYGPKFGLVAVDRHHDLARMPRPSYHLFAEISKTGMVTKKQRDDVWEELQTAVEEGIKRPFCRGMDTQGLMFSAGLNVPIELSFGQRDWRFGHYVMDGLQDPLSRFVRFIFSGGFLGRRTSRDVRYPSAAKEYEKKRVSSAPKMRVVADSDRILTDPILEEADSNGVVTGLISKEIPESEEFPCNPIPEEVTVYSQ